MNARSRRRILILLSTCLIAVAGCGKKDATSGEAVPKTDALGVIQAENSSLTTKENRQLLTLVNVKQRVIVFSDRPRRVAGTASPRSVVENWTNAFGDDPPNAALVPLGSSSPRKPMILELSSPEYTREAVTFTARSIETPGSSETTNGHFGPATLFIDDGGMMQLVAYGAQDLD